VSLVGLTSGDRREVLSLPGASIVSLGWAPSGRAIAVAAEGPRTRILVWPVATRGGARLLAETPGPVRDLGWSPDGRTIAWLAEAGTPAVWRVMTVPAAGGTARDMTAPSHGSPQRLSWSPDGRLSVVLANGGATWFDLCREPRRECTTVMPPGIAVLLTAPVWSRDTERYVVVGRPADHGPEVFAGLIPPPPTTRPDSIGVNPPPVRRVTFSNP